MVTRCIHCGSLTFDRPLFVNTKQRILEYIAKHPGCTISDIFHRIYGHRENGGPDIHVINVFISQMRPILKDEGLAIRASTRGIYATYKLELT